MSAPGHCNRCNAITNRPPLDLNLYMFSNSNPKNIRVSVAPRRDLEEAVNGHTACCTAVQLYGSRKGRAFITERHIRDIFKLLRFNWFSAIDWFSAMDFGKHWKQLMGVTIGRGRVECATAAVRAGRSATSAGAVAEYSPYSV